MSCTVDDLIRKLFFKIQRDVVHWSFIHGTMNAIIIVGHYRYMHVFSNEDLRNVLINVFQQVK